MHALDFLAAVSVVAAILVWVHVVLNIRERRHRLSRVSLILVQKGGE